MTFMEFFRPRIDAASLTIARREKEHCQYITLILTLGNTIPDVQPIILAIPLPNLQGVVL